LIRLTSALFTFSPADLIQNTTKDNDDDETQTQRCTQTVHQENTVLLTTICRNSDSDRGDSGLFAPPDIEFLHSTMKEYQK
jgi:hypothetical protein